MRYLVRGNHFRSHDKDGGHTHTIRSAVVENPMLHASFTVPSSTEPQLMSIEVYIAGIANFALSCCCDLDFDPMTFIYDLDP